MPILKTFLSVLILISILHPISSFAQYGGTSIVTGSSASTGIAPIFSSSATSNSVTVSITSGKKGDVIKVAIANSTNGVSNISFTLNADVANAGIVLSKADLSLANPGLPTTPSQLFVLTLTNLNYDQIINLSFDFAISGLAIPYSGFSSNSPWVPASVTVKTAASNASNKTTYTAGPTSIAFKQFAIIPTSNLSTVSASTAATTSSNSIFSTSTPELVRTGEMSTPVKFTLSVITVLLIYSLVFAVFRSNKN